MKMMKKIIMLSMALTLGVACVIPQLNAVDGASKQAITVTERKFKGMFDSLVDSSGGTAVIRNKEAFEALFKVDGEYAAQHLIAAYREAYEAIDAGDTSAYWADGSESKLLYTAFVKMLWDFCSWASLSLRTQAFYGSKFQISIDGKDPISALILGIALIDPRIAMENPKAPGQQVFVSHIETANKNYFSATKMPRMPHSANGSANPASEEQEEDGYTDQSTGGMFNGDATFHIGDGARIHLVLADGSQTYVDVKKGAGVSVNVPTATKNDTNEAGPTDISEDMRIKDSLNQENQSNEAGPTDISEDMRIKDSLNQENQSKENKVAVKKSTNYSLPFIGALSALSVPALDVMSRLSLDGFQDPRMAALAVIVGVAVPAIVATRRGLLG